ncbi:hypothetical protein ACP4OV_020019 [Aristida adscensionis]
MESSSSSAPSTTTTPPSRWCYTCHQLVRPAGAALACPLCQRAFLHHMDAAAAPPRRHADRSPYNPVIVLRRSAGAPPEDDDLPGPPAATFDLFLDDAAGSGLRPPPPETMSDFLLSSGFELLLHRLLHAQAAAAVPPCGNPPASKAAVESMPTVLVAAADSHCAVCTDAFELAAEATEMPCGHIYHRHCILPWLALRNSCPVCRHEMPAAAAPPPAGAEDDAVGLTIWRLPGGGFAVGRLAAGGGTELPVAYVEMDPGAFNDGGGAPRRNRSTARGVIGRLFHGMFACFGHARSTNAPASSSTWRRQHGHPHVEVAT